MSTAVRTNGHAAAPRPADDAAAFRRLMVCRGEAAERHRVLAGRALGLDRTEAAAMALLSTVRALTPGALANRLVLSSPAVSSLVARLEDRGAVERHGHPYDRRSVLVSASATHLEAAGALYAPLVADLDWLIERLSPVTRTEALDFLPEATALLHRRGDALVADAVRSELLAAAPLAPGPWA